MTSPRYRLMPALSLALLLLLPAPGAAELVDRVVAVVNDEVITVTELNQEGEKVFAAIRRSTPPAEREAALTEARKQLLQKMIDNRLLIQKAGELKFDVSPEEVDGALDRLAADNNMTRQQLLQEVAREGFSEEEYRKFTTDQIRRSRLINFEITSRIVISDERVRSYYDNVYLKETPPPGYHLLLMGFRWDTEEAAANSLAEARQRAERFRKLVEDGQDFRELARSFSELPSAKDGGDLGTLKLQEMTADMRNLLRGLEPGQLSQIEERGGAVQFFQVLTINTGDQILYPPFAMVQFEIRERLYREEMEKRLENWMKELREQAIIKELL
jgi:peptidyl-prolyl cis-trans isomerase SurA